MKKLAVGILLFENVEVLDFAGPFEVFSRTRLDPGTASRMTEESAPFRVFTVAAKAELIRATGGLQVVADHGFDDAPPIELLVVPGGFGTRPLLEDHGVLEWIRATADSAHLVTSVCTGALLLAKIGLLRDKRATTHWAALDLLQQIDPSIDVQREERVVRDGVISSAGVSAGIDMAFAVVEDLHGKAVADETARYIDYPRA
jgi:transcriptional regulator GlxA family with amidase domain